MGEVVLVMMMPSETSKLETRQQGHYEVVKKLSQKTYSTKSEWRTGPEN